VYCLCVSELTTPHLAVCIYVYYYHYTGSASLRVLNVAYNPIGDDGISLIVDHLHGNTTLTKLYVDICGLSAKGTDIV